MHTTAVHVAGRSEIPMLADALARAFYDDPVCQHVWPNDARRRTYANLSFTRQMEVLWDRRVIHADAETRSVAVWARPDEWDIPLQAVLRTVPTWLRARVGLRALLAYLRTDKLHPEEPHWYLEFLGTVPEAQGKGLGGAVLEPVLAQADREGVAVWTWSSNRKNLAFYHRHGFVVLDELPFADRGPSIFPIRRAPQD